MAANIQLENSSGSQTSIKGFKPRGLFDPRWQTGQLSSSTTGVLPPIGETGVEPAVGNGQGDGKPSGMLPPVEASPIRSGGLLSDIDPLSPLPATTTTGSLQVPGNGAQTAATADALDKSALYRPTGVMKVVQVPVAGQPGR